MSSARPASESAPRTSPGSFVTSGTRPARKPRSGSAGRGRGAGMSMGSRTAAASVRARRPSARAWWNLNRTAKEVPSTPGTTWASHGGLPRSRGRCMSTCGRGVEVGGGGVQADVVERFEVGGGLAGRAAEVEGLPDVADPHAQSGYTGRAGGEQIGRVPARGGRVGREDAQCPEVHGVLGGFDAPERQVEWCEKVGVSGPYFQWLGSRVDDG